MQKEFKSIESRLKDIKIEKKMGHSALGRSYKISHKKYGECLLKIIAGKVKKNKKFIERFFKDLEKAMDFLHPNVGKIYEISGMDGDFLYVIREYIVGTELQQWIYGKKKISIENGNKVLLQTVSGLGFLHSKGLVYRNLKPNNFIIDKDFNIKLVDFSLPPTLAQYLSPEQCKGKKSDVRSDIYALGSIYFYYMSGRTIFVGATSREIMEAHVTQEAPNIKKYRSDISENMCSVFEKMTTKKPEDRYQNCQELFFEIKDAAKMYDNSYQMPELQKIEPKIETTETSTIELVRSGNSWEKSEIPQTMDTSTLQLIRVGHSWKTPEETSQSIDISDDNVNNGIDINPSTSKLAIDEENYKIDITPSGSLDAKEQNYDIGMSSSMSSDIAEQNYDINPSQNVAVENYSIDINSSSNAKEENYSIDINPSMGLGENNTKIDTYGNSDGLVLDSFAKTGHFLAPKSLPEENASTSNSPELTMELPNILSEENVPSSNSPELTIELPNTETTDCSDAPELTIELPNTETTDRSDAPELTIELPNTETTDRSDAPELTIELPSLSFPEAMPEKDFSSENDVDTFSESSLLEIYTTEGSIASDDKLEVDEVTKNISVESTQSNLLTNLEDKSSIELEKEFQKIPSIVISEEEEIQENNYQFATVELDKELQKIPSIVISEEEVDETEYQFETAKDFLSIPGESENEKTVTFAYGEDTSGLLPGKAKLENKYQQAAVLFSSIKLSYNEHGNVDHAVNFLNKCMDSLEISVEKNKGSLNKCLANHAMSIFNEENKKNHSWLAIKTALEIKLSLKKISSDIAVNSAIHNGEVINGRIGSKKLITKTIAGENVDITYELIKLCSYYDCEILVTEAALSSCKNHVIAREIDYIVINGSPIRIYEITALASDFIDEDVINIHEMYVKARRLYCDGKFALALEKFMGITAIVQNDKPCALHITRCIHFIATPPKNWDGIWEFKI